ncbi:hypothetical protein ABPG74_017341 [Tetrahymena malaccensis]
MSQIQKQKMSFNQQDSDLSKDELLLGNDYHEDQLFQSQGDDKLKQSHLNDERNLSPNNLSSMKSSNINIQNEGQGNSIKCYIFAWGKNESGELSFGNQKQPFYNKPENPKNLDRIYIKQISTSQNHSACISANGELFVCGSALHGKLGLEDLTMANINKFQMISIFKGMKVLQVACGDYHTLALTDNDQVYSWGGTLHKKVGQRSGKPAPIQQLNKKGVIQVDCGDYHSVAITQNGDVYTWGGGGQDYNKGQLGLGHVKDIENPEKLKFFEGKKIVKVSCGQFHTVALTSENELYAWGAGEFGELGTSKFKHEYTPVRVKVNFNQYNILYENILFENSIQNPQIIDMKCGGHHTLLLTNNGYIYSSGYGRQGQLGLRNSENQCEFQLVWTLTKKKIIKIAAGWNHSLALSDQNDIFACGHGARGQLGLGDEESRTVFTHVVSLGGKNTATISAGGDHSWAVLDQNFPIKQSYRPPSPLRSLDTRPLNKSRDVSPDLSMMKENPSKILPDEQKIIFEKILQVVYVEVDLCHRFVRFTLIDPSKPFKKRLDEYLEEIKQFENGGIVFTKWQNDDLLLDENNNQINKKENLAKNITLMMICHPNRSAINQNQNELNQQYNNIKDNNTAFSNLFKTTSVGDMTLYKESDVQKDPTQQKLGYWFVLFSKKFKSIVEKMKFFELRPQSLNNNPSQN